MRVVILTVLASAQSFTLSCTETYETVSKADANPDFYLPQSTTTDPGQFGYLCENLPDLKDSVGFLQR